MALPISVRMALRLGNALAAPVAGSRAGGQAWVYVEPVLRSGNSFRRQLTLWTLEREAGNGYDDTIDAYKVRFLDLSSWNPDEDLNYEFDRLPETRGVKDERTVLPDENALEAWLFQYLDDLAQLAAPRTAGYHFGWR